MHAEWRLYRRFLMWCAAKEQTDNQQVVEDPNVSHFNTHRFFFLDVVTRACAEYVNFIAKTPGAESLDNPEAFIAKAEANVDFAWICHFLFDAGFFVLDFLQSIRANDSHKIDLLWREFYASAHTSTANKTQYVPMAIMRVFWGMALKPELSDLLHALRTIPSDSGESGVGWDMAIENLNLAIKQHVAHHVSETQVKDYCMSHALIETIQKDMRELLYGSRAAHHGSHNVDATTDVNKLVERMKAVVGTTWQAATQPKTTASVVTGPTASLRKAAPWTEVETAMERAGNDHPSHVIRQKVKDLTPFFQWQA